MSTIATNSSSLNTFTPNSVARFSLLPAESPAMRKSVLALTSDAMRPPFCLMRDLAWSRVRVSRVPVRTKILPPRVSFVWRPAVVICTPLSARRLRYS